MKRGISGGERKRVSIGYELISEPSILLLDEPTSGLDAHSARRVVQQLRIEAQRGLAVMATIHQPSSEVFHMFDRVILLAEGRVIYNGKPHDVQEYFAAEPFGVKMGQYCNPADKLLTFACIPNRCFPGKDNKTSDANESALDRLEKLCR